jgi:hypothetical protein
MEVTALGVRTLPSGPKTADSRAHPRASQIPQFSPKTARNHVFSSSLPSSLSVPHLGLVHPNRTPSASSSGGGGPPPATVPPSPALPAPPAPPSAPSTSLPLRALRSFLPFGSGKTLSGNAATPGPSKGPFAGFPPIRRSSVTIERRSSGQFPGSGDDKDVAVISISPKASPGRPPRDISSTSSSADAHESSSSGSASHGELGAYV